MKLNFRQASLTCLCSFFFLSSAFADKASIQGVVKGPDGGGAKSADVRIERQDKKSAPTALKTDAKGRFATGELELGTYQVTATAGTATWTQIVKLNSGKPINLSISMKGAGGSTKAVAGNTNAPEGKTMTSKSGKKYVWVKNAEGQELGGHWEEADKVNQQGTAGSTPRVPTTKQPSGMGYGRQ